MSALEPVPFPRENKKILNKKKLPFKKVEPLFKLLQIQKKKKNTDKKI